MRSKIAKQILDETPKETRIFVRRYTDIVVRMNELLKSQPPKEWTYRKKKMRLF
jgi:hypothetical protein